MTTAYPGGANTCAIACVDITLDKGACARKIAIRSPFEKSRDQINWPLKIHQRQRGLRVWDAKLDSNSVADKDADGAVLLM